MTIAFSKAPKQGRKKDGIASEVEAHSEGRENGPERESERSDCLGAESVRWARIVALRTAIGDGSYRVPAADLADSLLRTGRCDHSAVLSMYSA